MKPRAENLVDRDETEVGKESAGKTLCLHLVLKISSINAGDLVNRVVQGINAENDRARKGLILDQKLHHLPWHNLTAIMLPIRFEGAARFQNGHPLEGVDVAADLFAARQQDVVLDIQNAGRSIGA